MQTQNSKLKTDDARRGQSLIEMLVAIAVGAILVTSAAALLLVSTRVGRETRFIQAASFLSQELMDKVAVFADRQWYCVGAAPACGIYSLQKDQANPQNRPYYLSGEPLTATPGLEQINIDNVVYTRYFFVENVVRQLCGIGDITTIPAQPCAANFGAGGFAEDPSTQRVTVVTTWGGNGEARIVRYLTRHRNELFHQTDWSGGNGQSNFPPFPAAGISQVNSSFASHACIDFSNPGSIQIQSFCP